MTWPARLSTAIANTGRAVTNMRILVLDEEFPYPPNTGKRIRSLNLWKRLAEKQEVYYLAYGDEDSENYRMFQQLGMNPIAVKSKIPKKSGLLFYLRLFLNLFSKYPYIVSSHHSRLFKNEMKKAIEEISPHLIVCEWTPYAVFVEDIKDIKKVIVAHNIETHIWRRYHENEKGKLRKWYIGKQAEKLETFERAVFRRVDGATAVSEIDATDIHSFDHRLPVKVVQNGVDLDYFTPDDSEPAGNSLVFVGTMDWRPNQDAVIYFSNEIFPLVKDRNPDAEVYFVGRNPPSHIRELDSRPGINVTGSVDDVRPYIRRGTVYIVPLRIGGGTRLKILDAMAMKKAIVSTVIGAEGLDVNHGENILLAESPEQFAAEVETLFNEPDLSKRLGENGRELVEKKYGWDHLSGKLEDFLNMVVKGQ